MKTTTLLRLVIPIFLTTLALVSAVLGDATATAPEMSQTDDRSSKFYLLLNDDSLDPIPPYQKQIKEIDRLGRAQDLKGLARLADGIEQTWGHQADTRYYFALMDEITNILRSTEFGPNTTQEQFLLTRKYALATLAHRNVPLNITAGLLSRLIPEEELMLSKRPFNTVDWVQLRSTRAPLWLQTRQRLKQLVIPDFDFTKPIFVSIPLDLEALRYPDRAASRQSVMERNKAIQDNNQRVRELDEQLFVRLQNKILSPMVENEIISYYSQPPYDPQELNRLLDTYAVEAAARQNIFDQVANNIAASTAANTATAPQK